MRPFDHHIHSLLLQHDCVIVPSLGGFIASKEHARIDTARQLAVPPARTIAFNVYLKQNDGLLAKRLVDTEKVSYPEALQEIESYVSRCMAELGRGEKVNIRKVGRLSMNAANELRFEQDPESTLFPEAFGLSGVPVQLTSVPNSKSTEKSPPAKISKEAGKKSGRERSLIAALLIAGALTWFSVNVYLVSRNRYDKATMNPLDSVVPAVAERLVPVTPPAPARVETVFVATPPVVSETTKAVAPDTTAVKQQQVSATTTFPETGDYYLVAGVFKIRENAEKLIASLHAAGYSEASIIDTNRRLFYVSYTRTRSHREAAEKNDSLRKQSMESWIYRRK